MKHPLTARPVALCALVVACIACGTSSLEPGAGDLASDTARVAAHFVISGRPDAPEGATWTYRDTVDGIVYDLAGILRKPAGAGSFPAIIASHGAGGSASNYLRNAGTTMLQWGAVVIATNYTHTGLATVGLPGTAADKGGSVANVLRARRLVELLRTLGYVDINRVAAHGHSMGAFVTTAFAATYPDLLRVASHTAGGVRPDAGQGAAPTESQGRTIRTPYQMHHGDSDPVVAIGMDRQLDAMLQSAGTTHELHVYPGFDHDDVPSNPVVLERVRAWYAAHGMF